ncbi:MAG: hypothetical protein K2X38_02150 [Gemmataceae bacterium]|nr:hypothetical protein [Gemmataceae bacterium]
MANKIGKLTYHKRIMNILADGEWHAFTDILAAVARHVDAGTAQKEYMKRHPNWKDEKQTVRVAQGRRRLVFLSLNSAIHHAETVTARGHGDERKYRLTAKALKARCPKGPKRPESQP